MGRVSLKVSLKVSKVSLKVSRCTMKVSLKVWEGGQVAVFVSGKKGERNPAFGELSAQMRGTGVEHASRATCKTAAKTRAPNSPKKRATLLAFGEIGNFWLLLVNDSEYSQSARQ